MRYLDYEDLNYGVTDGDKIVALFVKQEHAELFADTSPSLRAVEVYRNDWTTASVKFEIANDIT